MSTHKHHWRSADPYDGGLHYCQKCDRWAQGERPEANDCPMFDTEHTAVAWLGPAGLYRTRLEGVQNGEQRLQPVLKDQLSQLAKRHVHTQLNEDNKPQLKLSATNALERSA